MAITEPNKVLNVARNFNEAENGPPDYDTNASAWVSPVQLFYTEEDATEHFIEEFESFLKQEEEDLQTNRNWFEEFKKDRENASRTSSDASNDVYPVYTI